MNINIPWSNEEDKKRYCTAKIKELLKLGEEKIPLKTDISTLTLQGESFNSDLHRGYYHPSPVYELIVGNARRGTRKRRTVNSAHSNGLMQRYWCDSDGRLTLVENFYQEKPCSSENLYYDKNKRIGIILDQYDQVSTVSEETFDNNQLVKFSIAHFTYFYGAYTCLNIRIEHYGYNSEGLEECDFVYFSPSSGMLVSHRYRFENMDGYMTAYSDISNGELGKRYELRKKRKLEVM